MYSNQTPTPTNNTEAFLDHDDADLSLLGGSPGTSLSPHTPCAEEDGSYDDEDEFYEGAFVLDEDARKALEDMDNADGFVPQGTPVETAGVQTSDEEQLLGDQNALGSEQDADEDDLGALGPNQESIDVEERPRHLGRADSGDSSVSTESSEEEGESLAERAARLDAERAAALKTQEEQKLLDALGKIKERLQRGEKAPGYGQPVLRENETEEDHQRAYDDWLGWLPLWKDSKDEGYAEYQIERKKKMAAVTAARRAQEAADREAKAEAKAKREAVKGFAPVERRTGESEADFAVRRAKRKKEQDQYADPTHHRHADWIEYQRKKKAQRAKGKPSPAPRRQAVAKPPPTAYSTPTDFGAVIDLLQKAEEALKAQLDKEVREISDARSPFVEKLAAYRKAALECYDKATERAKESRDTGRLIPNPSKLRAYEFWDHDTGAEKSPEKVRAQAEALLQSCSECPREGDQVSIGDLLKGLADGPLVCEEDLAILSSKMLEMAGLVKNVLSNGTFQAEALLDSSKASTLAELQSNGGLLTATPFVLARYMLSLNTPGSEGARKILGSEAWHSLTSLGMVVHTATKSEIPDWSKEGHNLEVLRNILSDLPPKVHAETWEDQLAGCLKARNAFAAIKNAKSAPADDVKKAQGEFDAARGDLEKRATFIEASVTADGKWRPCVVQKKSLSDPYKALQKWAEETDAATEASLKGPLTADARVSALKKRQILGPHRRDGSVKHFVDTMMDYAHGLHIAVVEYLNALCYMYLLILATLAPEFCSKLSFKKCLLLQDFGRSKATPHEVMALLLETAGLYNLVKPVPGGLAHFKHHVEMGDPDEEVDQVANTEPTGGVEAGMEMDDPDEEVDQVANTEPTGGVEAGMETGDPDEEVDQVANTEPTGGVEAGMETDDPDGMVRDHRLLASDAIGPGAEEVAPPQETDKEVPRKKKGRKSKPKGVPDGKEEEPQQTRRSERKRRATTMPGERASKKA